MRGTDTLGRGDSDGGRLRDEVDELVASLQYRDAREHAVGHNVSVSPQIEGREPGTTGVCREIRTEWMPTAEVEKVTAAKLKNVELGMESLAALEEHAALMERMKPLLTGYETWIAEQRGTISSLSEERHRKTAEALLDRAERALERIRRGLEALKDDDAFEAFRIANRSIARALRQRSAQETGKQPDEVAPPEWRPFQLAFLLLNLSGVIDPSDEAGKRDRKTVDLLFFPTGGGKTEAYLGLAAFTILLRRLRNPGLSGAGVTVLMRYTLRLLTLDQLDRASTLVCALELERQAAPERLGTWPLEIGLWVGQGATPNRLGKKGDNDKHSARRKLIAFKNDPSDPRNPAPLPIQKCPWCGYSFVPESFRLLPDGDQPTDMRVHCANKSCVFWSRGEQPGLPVLGVDEPIYRRLPCFIIATVDKFASLPWTGDTSNLFGRVTRHDEDGFYGPGSVVSGSPSKGQKLEAPLAPPELIIQDELHLISGPLGTMVGLYETAIDALCRSSDGLPPKIIASTATVRRAERQIRALFGRTQVEIFPPPGPDRRDSYFACTVSADERNPRCYVGIGAQGRNLKVVLLRAYLTLMSAAQRQYALAGGAKNTDNPADPYMTLLGYFNSLRELGGSRRIVEDEVSTRLTDYAERRQRPSDDPKDSLLANRSKVHAPQELTSRVSTAQVSRTKDELKLRFHDKKRVDVALATNMISVGLDITRLGLMVVLGQPKTVAEYIQSTSRVGRDDDRPGLVVTLLNVHRPRDRSYYERFEAFHESFYRAVEPTSVTPFSSGALERGLAGVTVALSRHVDALMTPPRGAGEIEARRTALESVVTEIAGRAGMHDRDRSNEEAEDLRAYVKSRVQALLDAWANIADDLGDLQYAGEASGVAQLIYPPLHPDLARIPKSKRFVANRSLRDVEATVDLWLAKSQAEEELL